MLKEVLPLDKGISSSGIRGRIFGLGKQLDADIERDIAQLPPAVADEQVYRRVSGEPGRQLPYGQETPDAMDRRRSALHGTGQGCGVERGILPPSHLDVQDCRQVQMHRASVVLEILETVTFDEALFRRCNDLRRRGFRLALDDVSEVSPRLLAFLPCVDIVKIDLIKCPRERLAETAGTVMLHGKVAIAEKVETPEDHDAAMRAGFELFQGYHFAKPQVLTSRRITPSRDALLRMLVLLSGEPWIVELEAELKRIPNLVIQLLRLLGSSAVGFPRTISSLREAIMIVGTRQITRWTQLLLFADGHLGALRSDPLTRLCATRARFMELAAGRLRLDDDRFADTAFMTGVFSLVHVLFGTAIEDSVSTLPIHTDIRRALLERHGGLGLLLNATEAAESGDLMAIRAACEALPGFTPNDLTMLGLAAAAWYDDQVQGNLDAANHGPGRAPAGQKKQPRPDGA
jgi:EAL and modified HD-GYP domain-containing signal transduction protein